MALPGLLVEYLVVGSMALIWFLPLVMENVSELNNLGLLALFAPAIYVLGMFVDFLAFVIVSIVPRRKFSLKALVRKLTLALTGKDLKRLVADENNVYNNGHGRTSKGTIMLNLEAPAVYKEVLARSSRDRIARGAFTNLILIWLLPKVMGHGGTILLNLNNTSWVLLIAFSMVMWGFFEGHSFKFELRAGDMIKGNKEM